jgi:hypothetical protein
MVISVQSVNGFVVLFHVRFSQGLVNFVRHLRSPHVDENPCEKTDFYPIVILHPRPSNLPAFPYSPTNPIAASSTASASAETDQSDTLNLLSEFTEVYHIQGSALSAADMARADIEHARYVYVLGQARWCRCEGK